MDAPIAEVVSMSGRHARVAVDAPLVCARCAAGRGCGAGILGRSTLRRVFDVRLPDGLLIQCGDQVTLTLHPRKILRASLLVYGLPLLMLVLVPTLTQWLWGPWSDLRLAIAAVLGLVAAVLSGRHVLNREDCLQQFMPGIETRVAAKGHET
jgi:sigma-E factor negative regulatory protein RseC